MTISARVRLPSPLRGQTPTCTPILADGFLPPLGIMSRAHSNLKGRALVPALVASPARPGSVNQVHSATVDTARGSGRQVTAFLSPDLNIPLCVSTRGSQPPFVDLASFPELERQFRSFGGFKVSSKVKAPSPGVTSPPRK